MKMRFSLLCGLLLALTACGQKTTKSGAKYTMITDVSGNPAKVGDIATINVSVYADSTLLDVLTKMKPMDVPIASPDSVSAEEKGIMEALSMMSIGDSLALYQPVDSTMKGEPRLANAKFLVYHISLKKIVAKADMDKRRDAFGAAQKMFADAQPYFKGREKAVADSITAIAADYSAGKITPKATPSGVKILVLREGTGEVVKADDMLFANYYGVLKSGKRFDDSYSRGQPYPFPVGGHQVITGWDEGFQGLKEGTTAVLFIPSEMGYGAQGNGPGVPPNSELLFYVEALKKI